VRPKEVLLTGYDLDGNEISLEADEYLARVLQHELDHLDGVLLFERLDREARKEAMRVLRNRNVLSNTALERLEAGDGTAHRAEGAAGEAAPRL
jgi:peptide deformylase